MCQKWKINDSYRVRFPGFLSHFRLVPDSRLVGIGIHLSYNYFVRLDPIESIALKILENGKGDKTIPRKKFWIQHNRILKSQNKVSLVTECIFFQIGSWRSWSRIDFALALGQAFALATPRHLRSSWPFFALDFGRVLALGLALEGLALEGLALEGLALEGLALGLRDFLTLGPFSVFGGNLGTSLSLSIMSVSKASAVSLLQSGASMSDSMAMQPSAESSCRDSCAHIAAYHVWMI